MSEGKGRGGVHDVREYGARGDGTAADGTAMQAAIDACSAAGGGVVRVPPGRYVTGTLQLRDGVTFRVEAGAAVLGSTDIADYDPEIAAFVDGTGVRRGDALICARDAVDVAVEGSGVIDGRGAGFRERRPMLLRFLQCRGVRVSGVTLKDAAAWVHHYLRCEDVRIHAVTVRSRCNKNNDGLNLDGCRRVRVSDCHFSSGDDALTLKSTSPARCEDVVITNCLLNSDCNGLKFGTESIGGFRNVSITNCVVYDTRLCGITVATVDGGDLEDVVISNITMRNVGAAFFLRRGRRAYHLPEGTEDRPVGILRGVVLKNIQARGVDPTGSSILGLPEAPVEDVVLEGIRIVSNGGGTAEDAAREVPRQPARYPQYEQWGTLPAWALYCRDVRGLRVRDFLCECAGEDARPAVVCEGIDDVRFDDVRTPDGRGDAAIRLRGEAAGILVDGIPPER